MSTTTKNERIKAIENILREALDADGLGIMEVNEFTFESELYVIFALTKSEYKNFSLEKEIPIKDFTAEEYKCFFNNEEAIVILVRKFNKYICYKKIADELFGDDENYLKANCYK